MIRVASHHVTHRACHQFVGLSPQQIRHGPRRLGEQIARALTRCADQLAYPSAHHHDALPVNPGKAAAWRLARCEGWDLRPSGSSAPGTPAPPRQE